MGWLSGDQPCPSRGFNCWQVNSCSFLAARLFLLCVLPFAHLSTSFSSIFFFLAFGWRWPHPVVAAFSLSAGPGPHHSLLVSPVWFTCYRPNDFSFFLPPQTRWSCWAPQEQRQWIYFFFILIFSFLESLRSFLWWSVRRPTCAGSQLPWRIVVTDRTEKPFLFFPCADRYVASQANGANKKLVKGTPSSISLVGITETKGGGGNLGRQSASDIGANDKRRKNNKRQREAVGGAWVQALLEAGERQGEPDVGRGCQPSPRSVPVGKEQWLWPSLQSTGPYTRSHFIFGRLNTEAEEFSSQFFPPETRRTEIRCRVGPGARLQKKGNTVMMTICRGWCRFWN